MSVERKEIGLRTVTLSDLETARLDLTCMTLAKFSRQSVITLDERDTARGGIEDVRGKGPHAGTNLHEVIAGLRIKAGDDGLRQVRIEEEILPEHLARSHTDLIETGAKFCFGHRQVIKPCGGLRQPR
jgi:hypothetical protein